MACSFIWAAGDSVTRHGGRVAGGGQVVGSWQGYPFGFGELLESV